MERTKFAFWFLVFVGITQAIFLLTSCNQYQQLNHTSEFGKEGKWVIKNDTTNQVMVANYKRGKRHGEYLHFYENGQVSVYGFYKMDKRHKIWQRFWEHGAIASTTKYRNGRILEHKIYSPKW